MENVYLGRDGDGDLQLRHDPDRTTPVAPNRADVDHIAFTVDDVAETFETAIDAGAAPVLEPTEVDAADAFAAFVEDPEGYTLEFYHGSSSGVRTNERVKSPEQRASATAPQRCRPDGDESSRCGHGNEEAAETDETRHGGHAGNDNRGEAGTRKPRNGAGREYKRDAEADGESAAPRVVRNTVQRQPGAEDCFLDIRHITAYPAAPGDGSEVDRSVGLERRTTSVKLSGRGPCVPRHPRW